MQAKKIVLGPIATRLMAFVQMTGKDVISTSEIATKLRITPLNASKLVYRLSSDSLAIQLKKGLYLFPEKLPPGGRWQPMLEKVVWYYLKEKEAKWQETGLGVFNYYGLSEQISNTATIYNDKVSQVRKFTQTTHWG